MMSTAFWVILAATHLTSINAQSPCSDGRPPTCPNGEMPQCAGAAGGNPPCSDGSRPGCTNGQPVCSDGNSPTGPGEGGGNPGGIGGNDPTQSSEGCSPADGTPCDTLGSTVFKDNSALTLTSSGKFTGTMKGNQCPIAFAGPGLTSTCSQVTFPVAGYETGPKMAALRGVVGYSFTLNNIYGPFEGGFGNGAPEVCTVANKASCEGGMDVPMCEAKIKYECETGGGEVKVGMLLDDCGGHAQPYHYHIDLRCDYDQHEYQSHSPLIGVALDGYGIYGIWEGNGQLFPAVDACNGHTGPVPISTHEMYHYHTTPYMPYTIGCFGPVDSIDACKRLYQTCNEDNRHFTIRNSSGDFHISGYDLDCPCVQHYSAYATAKLSTLRGSYQDLLRTDPYEGKTWTDPASTNSTPTPTPVVPSPTPTPTPVVPSPDPSPSPAPTPTPMMTEYTCGEIKEVYIENGCCGYPEKPFSFPDDDDIPNRRLSDIPNNDISNESDPYKILRAFEHQLHETRAKHGEERSSYFAEMMEAVLEEFLSHKSKHEHVV